jgi:hypothetical protein
VLAVVFAGAPAAEPPPAFEPRPLRGVPLAGPTGLRLLVADTRPFVLDVDRGRIERIAGLPVRRPSTVWVVPVGVDAVFAVWRPGSKLPNADLYAVRHGTTRASRIGAGWSVAAAADGRSLWVLAHETRTRCVLRRLDLDGRRLSWRRLACAMRLEPAGAAGIVVGRQGGPALVDPETGRTLLRARRVLAALGRVVLTAAEPLEPLTLTDLDTGARQALAWPSRLDETGGAAVSPDGRLAAVEFADPAFELTATQVLDLWLLDAATGAFTQLPEMPADVALKDTSMAWSDDGRLVLLAESERRSLVAVWRPGDERFGVREVPLPERSGGSDSFVLW